METTIIIDISNERDLWFNFYSQQVGRLPVGQVPDMGMIKKGLKPSKKELIL